MKTQIDISCPDCHSPSLSIRGIKSYDKQHNIGIEGNNCRLRIDYAEPLEEPVVSLTSLIITLESLTWCSFIPIMAMSDASILFRSPPNNLIKKPNTTLSVALGFCLSNLQS